MSVDNSFELLYQIIRDRRFAEEVFFAGIGLVIAFLVLYLFCCAVESIALVIGIPAILVGAVSFIGTKIDAVVVEKKTGITWDELKEKTWDELSGQ